MNGESCNVEVLSDSLGYKIVCVKDSVGVVVSGKDGTGCELSGDGNGTATLSRGEDSVSFYKALCVMATYDPVSAICDARDGQVYKVVKISARTWMKEN